MKTARDHYLRAVELRERILNRQSNETPVRAWAEVARECAIANNKFWAEQGSRVHGVSQQSFLTNLNRIWQAATARVETLNR